MKLTRAAAAAIGLLASSAVAATGAAACTIAPPAAPAQVSVLANSFPSLQFLAGAMKSCSGGTLTVEAKLTPDVTTQARTMLAAGGTAPFAIVQVSNGTFTEFAPKGYLQPITDLVRKYWDAYKLGEIPEHLWKQVTYDGQIYAVPFQTNAEVLFYREDLLQKHGIAVPHSYAEFLAAARKLRESEPGMEAPVAEAYGGNWSLANEFGNIYQSLGGTWFDAKGQPLFNDAKGVKAVELMRSLLGVMSPNALSFSVDDTMVAFQQGHAALGVVWASRAATMDAPDVSRVIGKVKFAVAPPAEAGGTPSTALWWDGFVLPKTIGVDRDLAFRIIMEATSQASYRKGGNVTFWARNSVTSDPALIAANRYWPAMNATIARGAATTPTAPYFNVAQTAIGAVLADALKGTTTPKEALDRAAAAYLKQARAQGYF
jgi:ABC-type glycerol-3-phosphate transport system substrate-binding protein